MNKILYLIGGLVVTTVVMVAIISFLSKSNQLEVQVANKVFSQAELQKVKSQTSGLENFGNLPVVVTGDQLGRENPFDPYK